MTALAYSVVTATHERPDDLRRLLASLEAQSWPPSLVVVVDSSHGSESERVARDFAGRLPMLYERAHQPSAARQRNQGSLHVSTPLIAFIDDDAVVFPGTAETIAAAFAEDEAGEIGGIAARIQGLQHRAPRGLLRKYYRWQAGYEHATYGGKLFGAAINCLPSYEEAGGDLIPGDWLNSTCTFYRTPLFEREKFPAFEGYSFQEDVHLSARIARTHRLYFHRTASFEHRDSPSSFKRDFLGLARMRVRHQRMVAKEIVGLREPVLTLKLLLHRLFVSFLTVRRRERGWARALLGTWT